MSASEKLGARHSWNADVFAERKSMVFLMDGKTVLLVLVTFIQMLIVSAQKKNQDYVGLMSLKDVWENTPPSWDGVDPCREKWVGIGCTNSRVTSIKLASMNLTGELTGDLAVLSELLILDLSYNIGLTGNLPPSIGNIKKLTYLVLVGCGFTGPIPDTIGSLQKLQILSLNSNKFNGPIPPSFGNLSNVRWLDIANNNLNGNIPVSTGTMPGLDMLVNTKHFHFGNNQLSGEIPAQLFSSGMALIHLLLENNQLSGKIPSTIGLAKSLERIRLDRNSLIGSVPRNLNNLTSVTLLLLANNMLTGPFPNLTGMNSLYKVDLSNNTFDAPEFPPWFPSLQSLAVMVMENTTIHGEVPVPLFSIPQLQLVKLGSNQLNGTFDMGLNPGNQLRVVDLANNNISAFTQRAGSNVTLILVNNPICQSTKGTENYCILPGASNTSYSTPSTNCKPTPCNIDQTSSPNCVCAYPYVGTLYFRAPSFPNLDNQTIYASLQSTMMSFFKSHQLPVDSVLLRDPTMNLDEYLVINLEIFPSGQDRFNRTGITEIAFAFSNQSYKPEGKNYGPYFFIPNNYMLFSSDVINGTNKSVSTGTIIVAVVGSCVVVLLLSFLGIYAFRQKRRAERATQQSNPFASWDMNTSSGIPQLKAARCFSFEDLKKFTNNFSEGNAIGSGGYGKVYRGTLTSGLLVAIKRADQGSMQGGQEFKTEIELLSRVHHKNVVSLLGFCFDQGEQMLVYEYIPNGTLKESLSGKSGIKLDWMRRLQVALGAAKGLQYLHDLANPPIIHRDIKSNNILLDDHLNAKVADFGLSKSFGDQEKGHVTTQVKGTMGYLDPEYYMTQQLTEKSDVYSFGVLMLELVTAKRPIEKGKYIVREVKLAMDKSKDRYNLHEILDPTFGLSTLRGLEKFVDLAMKCVNESGDQRPAMSEVVKEIEHIMELAGLNPNADSTSASSGYEGDSMGFDHPYSDKSLFIYSTTYRNHPRKLRPT